MATIRDILLQVSGQGGDAQRTLGEIAAELEAFDGTEAEAEVHIAKTAFEREVAEARAELDAAFSKATSAKVEIKIDTQRAELERVAKEGAAVFEQYFRPRIAYGMERGPIANMGVLLRDIAPVAQGLRQVSAEAEDMTTKLDSGASMVTRFGDKVSQISPIAGGLAIIIMASLVPAIGALIASLSAAVAGLATLAVGLAASLAPGLLGLLALVQNLIPVFKVLGLRQQENANLSADQAAATDKARAAAEAEHQARIGLRDALESETDARRRLGEATRAAREELERARESTRDAHRGTVDATRGVKDAESDLKDTRQRGAENTIAAQRRVRAAILRVKSAAREAFQHWKDLNEDVIDGQHRLANAVLEVEDAQLALFKAQTGYNQLLNEIPSDKIGDVLKKLNDVNLSPEQVQSFIQGAMGPNADPGFAMKLYEASLKLRHAQQDLKDATWEENKAQRALAESRRELTKLTKKGVDGYGPYKDAIAAVAEARRAEVQAEKDAARATRNARQQVARAHERVRDARRREAESQADLARLEQRGINQAPGVVAARNAIRDAEQRTAEARRRLARASRDAAKGTDALSSSQRRAKDAYGALTPAQQELTDALGGFLKLFKRSFGSNFVIGAITALVRGASDVLRELSGPLRLFGFQFAIILRQLAGALTGKGATSFFRSMIDLASQLAGSGAGALAGFARALANIAEAAKPGLVRFFDGLNSAMGNFADATGSAGGKRVIGELIDSTFIWLKAMGRVLGTFGRFVDIVRPFGDELIRQFGEWSDGLFRSGDGAEGLKRFFRDTIPFAKSVAGLIANAVKAAIQIFEFLAPIIKPMIDLTSSIIGMIATLVGWLNKLIPRPIREIAGFLVTIVAGAPKLIAFFGKLPGLLGSIARWVAKLGIIQAIVKAVSSAAKAVGEAAVAVGKAIASGVVSAFEAAADLASAMASWVGNAVKDAATWVAGVGKKVIDGIIGGFGKAVDFGTTLLEWVGKGIGEAASSVGSAGEAIANWLAGGLASLAGWGVEILKAIKNSVTSAASATGKGAVSAGSAIASWIVAGIKSGAEFGATILRWIASNIVKAAKGAASAGGRIVSWLWRGIKAAAGLGGRILSWIVGGIRKLIGGAAGIGKSIANWLWRGIKGAFSFGARLAGLIRSGLKGIVGIGRDIANWVWDGMKSLPGKILNGIKGAINTVIRGWNNLAFHIGGTDLGPLGHLPSINIGTPNIPELAAGGVVKREVVARIGEGRDKEAVIPLTDRVFGQLGAGIVAAMQGLSSPAFGGGGLRGGGVAIAAGPLLGKLGDTESGLRRGGVTEEHFHVHGHTQKVDPDPRTSSALLARHMRKKGQ